MPREAEPARVGSAGVEGKEDKASAGLALLLADDTTSIHMQEIKDPAMELNKHVRHVLGVEKSEFVEDGRVNIAAVQATLEARLAALADEATSSSQVAQIDNADTAESSTPMEGIEGAAAEQFSQPSTTAPQPDQLNGYSATGRLGPKVARMLRETASGDIKFEDGDLTLESQSNFSSARANVCVFKGKWMFEVTLGTAGIQQLGWATLRCPFTNEEGVGDAPDSFAYDGKRVKKWHVSCHPYGQAWVPGDVIGCCLDLSAGEITFYRNGVSLGVAFNKVRGLLPGAAYFPAVSLSHGERCHLNFGGRPLDYPVEGFLPLQDPPSPLTLSQADHLLTCFQRLVQVQSNEDGFASGETLRMGPSFASDDEVLFAAAILEYLQPLLNPYIVSSNLLPFLLDTLRRSDPHDETRLDKAVQLLVLCLEHHELQQIVPQLFEVLAHKCCTAFYNAADFPHSGAYPYLSLACSLMRSEVILDTWLSHPKFMVLLEGLLTRKQPNSQDLAALLPSVWWPEATDEICSQTKMKASCQALAAAVGKNEQLQLRLCSRLMTYTPVAQRSASVSGDKQGSVFQKFCRHILAKNRGVNRNVQPPGLSDNSVLVSLYFVVLRVLTPYLASSEPHYFPSRLFLDQSMEAFDVARLGGTVSHLRKTLPAEPADYEDVVVEGHANIASTSSSDDSRWGLNNEDDIRGVSATASGVLDAASNLRKAELLDCMTLLYQLGLSSNFKQASGHLQQQMQAIAQLEDTDRRIKRSEPGCDMVRHLKEARAVFREDVIENVRMCAWYRVTLFGRWKQQGMYACCGFIVQLLLAASKRNRLFSYVPEFYVETLVESFHALRRGDPPFEPTSTMDQGLDSIVTFLVTHFNDARIVNPDIRDVLLQSISVLLQYKEYVTAFEKNEAAQKSMIPSLMMSFDSRFWIPVANIFLRLCKGSGFGQRSRKGAECASAVFQRLLSQSCSAEDKLFSAFLNRLFNTLNWTITEFSVTMKEMQDAVHRRQAPDLQQQQRKCTIMFELSVNLERILEFFTKELPQAFLDGPELNATRLCELLVFVLNHTTSGPDARLFDSTLRLQMQQLEKINRAHVLAPIAGILLNLQAAEVSGEKPGKRSILDSLAAIESSYSMANFEYLLSFNWIEAFPEDQTIQASLGELQTFVARLRDRTEQVRRAAKAAEEAAASSKGKETRTRELCSICYANDEDTKFEPCGHTSCRRCISRHLLNNQRCFFCNAEVKELVDISAAEPLAALL
eukprot:jgi/Chlat1/5167/Chrsp33S05151